MNSIIRKSVFLGIAAAVLLLSFYFTVVSLVSGFAFAQDQFSQFWYFIVSLVAGFGIQIGMYVYLKASIQNYNMAHTKQAIAVTGTTSTLAMISCCAHYLANIVPILGIAGFLTVVAQYQIGLFWVGLFFNLLGIVYISNKIIRFRQASILFTPLDKPR